MTGDKWEVRSQSLAGLRSSAFISGFRNPGPWLVPRDPKICPYGHTTNGFLRGLRASVVKILSGWFVNPGGMPGSGFTTEAQRAQRRSPPGNEVERLFPRFEPRSSAFISGSLSPWPPCLRGEDSFAVFCYSRRDKKLGG